MRILVCDVWGKRGDAEAVEILKNVLDSDSDRDVRMAAARALGHLHDPAAVRACSPQLSLDDADPAMRLSRDGCPARVDRQKQIGTDPGDGVVSWRQKFVKGGVKCPNSLGHNESSRGYIRCRFASRYHTLQAPGNRRF